MDHVVEQSSSRNYMSMRNKAKKLLQKTDVDKLPSLPHVLLPLLKICHDESISYEDLADILQKDPALYIKLLSVCHRNGCSQGKDEKPEQLLKDLGINTLKSIATTSAVQQFFSRNSHERNDFVKQHWQHSLLCATIAESIAEHIEYQYPEEAYVAGLVHDIGQLVLESAYPNKYTATFAQLSEDDYFHDLEGDEFGTTHQHVGAELLKKHGAHNFLTDAILYHHEPTESILDAHPLVKIINIANQLGNANFKDEDKFVFDAAEELLGISNALLMEILTKSRERIKRFAVELEIDLNTDGIDGNTARQIATKEQFKQVQLAEQVKNIALLDGLHQHLSCANGEQGLLAVIKQQIGILFGIDQSLLFLYDAGDDAVRAVPSDSTGRLSDLNIPLLQGRSLVTDALLEKQTLHSFSDKYSHPTVIDQQLTGLAGHEGLMCLPMVVNNAAVGVLVFGIDETQQSTLWKQLPLLNHFANEIALTISASHSSDKNTNGSTDTSKILEARIREMVHEVGNPLSIINNYLEILGFKLEASNPAQSDIKTIKSEIERIGNIVRRLTEPSNTVGEVTQVDINALIADLTHVFQTSLFAAHNVQVSLDLDDRIQPMLSDANALKQVYTNLVKNAVEALPANGQIMVYTQDQVNVDGQEHIEISVADDGPGIQPDILSSLFTPVETTKGDGHAGLGLTIVRNLVNELHGSISCRSSDKGTSFHILLPKK
jgi:putative nucleotidyltransferase with HDIG domain